MMTRKAGITKSSTATSKRVKSMNKPKARGRKRT